LQAFQFNPINPPPNADDPTTPHRTIYLQLRTMVSEYIDSGMQPELELSVRPTGAHNWSPTMTAQEIGLPNDGPDESIKGHVS
jgi:hypothetical protein